MGKHIKQVTEQTVVYPHNGINLCINIKDELLNFSVSCIGEENGNPLQCSCLENPRDGEPGGLLSMGSHRVGHD